MIMRVKKPAHFMSGKYKRRLHDWKALFLTILGLGDKKKFGGGGVKNGLPFNDLYCFTNCCLKKFNRYSKSIFCLKKFFVNLGVRLVNNFIKFNFCEVRNFCKIRANILRNLHTWTISLLSCIWSIRHLHNDLNSIYSEFCIRYCFKISLFPTISLLIWVWVSFKEYSF